MTIKEILGVSSGGIAVILTLLEITKVKINPWTAIFKWLGNLFNHDILEKVTGIEKDIKTIRTDLDAVREEDARKEAENSRYRIIRFADECYMGVNHSMEHYKQILSDIDTYDSYCDNHPDFPNQIAVAASKMIRTQFEEHLKNHDFLG